MPPKQQIQLQNLDVGQLQSLKQQFQGDIESLTRALDGLKAARNRFNQSKSCLESYRHLEANQEMLVPMTSSLYVRGQVKDATRVVVDVGTGYYIQHSIPRAQAFFEKRAGHMDDHMRKITEAVQEKDTNLNMVLQVLQQKLAYIKQMEEGQ